MNYSDTERITAVLEALGYEAADTESDADLVIFNTCSVRRKAEDKVYGQLGKLAKIRKKRPELTVAITGCMVRKSSTKRSIKRDKLVIIEAVDIAFRIEDVAKLGELIQEMRPEVDLNLGAMGEGGELENYFKIAPKRESSAQVWIPIQRGCDKFCTFCIVPFTRGREQSREMQEILKECAQAVDNGAIEITLIGQTVDSYGLSVKDKMGEEFKVKGAVPNVTFNSKIFDEGKNNMASSSEAKTRETEERPFVTLLREVDKLKEEGLKRLRFTSPHPHDFSEDLIEIHSELETLQPYIHLPIQSGSNKMLKDMRRTYTREHYVNLIELIRKHIPECAISTDIIVGFAGETEEDFEESYSLMEQIEWDMAFLAIYSERPGTYATKHMDDDVPRKEKSRRFTRLNELLARNAHSKNSRFLDQTVEILVEQQKGTRCSGRTPEFKQVFFNSGRDLVGKLVKIHITNTENFFLEGELV
jgi:tRNA-2-methylthio-N6-dimethylallyladenosine synthase